MSNLSTKEKSQNTIVLNSSENLKHTRFSRLMKLLTLIQRAIKNLRDRTKYRGIKNFRESIFEVLDDQAHFKLDDQKTSFSFLKNKTLRYALAKVKRKFKFITVCSSDQILKKLIKINYF